MPTAEISGLKKQVKQLQAIATRTSDLTGVASKLYAIAQKDFTQRFQSSPSVKSSAEVYGGARWQRLSEAYLKRNPNRQGGKQLIDTGELRRSFLRGKPGNIARVVGGTVEFGSSLQKAVWLDKKRPLVVEHEELAKLAGDAIETYISTGK
jgi:phage gpG-like protein